MKTLFKMLLALSAIWTFPAAANDFDEAVKAFEKSDYRKAANSFQKACKSGSIGACYNLGFMYAEGMGVKRNAARAAELYRKTCEVGGAAACLKLRFSYANGTGVKQDNFGLIMYAERMGVKRNAARAAEVYRKACEGGSPGVCDNYEELKKQKAHQDTGG